MVTPPFFFVIVAEAFQERTLAEYQFIICLRFEIQTYMEQFMIGMEGAKEARDSVQLYDFFIMMIHIYTHTLVYIYIYIYMHHFQVIWISTDDFYLFLVFLSEIIQTA